MTQQSDTPAPVPPLVPAASPAGDIEAAIAALRPFVAAIESDDDDGGTCVCRKCRDLCECASGMDPTPLCHDCAQEAVAHLPALLAAVAKLVAEKEQLQDLINRAIKDLEVSAEPFDRACMTLRSSVPEATSSSVPR